MYNKGMEEYTFLVKLEVSVKAYSETDATEMIDDEFGLGENCGFNIKSIDIVRK
jgi:hypothetical protein